MLMYKYKDFFMQVIVPTSSEGPTKLSTRDRKEVKKMHRIIICFMLTTFEMFTMNSLFISIFFSIVLFYSKLTPPTPRTKPGNLTLTRWVNLRRLRSSSRITAGQLSIRLSFSSHSSLSLSR